MKKLNITGIEFDFSYLSLLTRSGIKPLSRWEAVIGANEKHLLSALGLHYIMVDRHLWSPCRVQETIFSRSPRLLQAYSQEFHNARIDKTRESIRLEGGFFGYPECCVDHFVRHSYQPNHLVPESQKLLFHWACPDCAATPILLPRYQKIHRQCEALYRQTALPAKPGSLLLGKKLVVAASLALFLSNPPQCSRFFIPEPEPFVPDAHLTALDTDLDPDQDYLENYYETILQIDGRRMDSDGNGIPDGPDLAIALWGASQSLPDQPRTDGPYFEHHMLRGLETCAVCSATVNMGYALIVNPMDNLSLQVPYISLHHFLEHGSFSYDGSVHGAGRINAALLHILINSRGRSHWLGQIYTDLEVTESRHLAVQIDSLPRTVQTTQPFVIEHQAKGVERCQSCGEYFNMGFLEIHNPVQKISSNLPFVALHFMHCGGTKYLGDHNSGIVDLALLKKVLQ